MRKHTAGWSGHKDGERFKLNLDRESLEFIVLELPPRDGFTRDLRWLLESGNTVGE